MITQRRFGFEIEAYNAPSSLVREKLEANGVNGYKVKRDASIRGDNPFEMVSKIHRGQLGLDTARKAMETLRDLGALTNGSCGFHVHIDMTSASLDDFKRVFKRFIKFEPIFRKLIDQSRLSNVYCKSLSARFGSKAEAFQKIKDAKTLEDLAHVVNGGLGTQNRYMALNIQSFWRHGTIEFRLKESTLDPEEVVNWISMLLIWVEDSLAINTRLGKDNPKEESLIEMMVAPRNHNQLAEPERRKTHSYIKNKVKASLA